MSKFNNLTRLVAEPRPPLVMTPSAVNEFRAAVITPDSQPAVDRSVMTKAGYFLLCALLLSGYLNDWSFRLLGGKAYLSTVCIVLVPAVWLIGGNTLAGFRDRIGVWWLALVLLMVMGLPFSVWRSASLWMIWSYLFRSLAYYFYIVSFATTMRRCRNLMLMNVFCAVIVLVTCMTFGSSGNANETRFQIVDSLFLSNSNELALQLLLGVTAFLFLFYLGGIGKGIAGVAGILLSVSYMLKTGSRGCLLSAIVLFLVVFFASKRKAQFALISVPVLALGLAVIPSAALRRFSLIFEPPPPAEAMTAEDEAAIGSTTQREELLRKGLEFTITHPVFGVGTGQFAVAYTGDAEKQGKHAPWLGTHNSYTEISSECGIPAFICYMAIIVLTFRRSYRIYRRAAKYPQLAELRGLAFCLFAGILVYSIGTFFFHMAYTVVLPLLSGQAVALNFAAEPLLAAAERLKAV